MISMSLDGLKKTLEDSESHIHYLTIDSTVSGSKNQGSYSIKGLLPREISITTSSEWSAPFDSGIGGDLSTALSLFGVSFKSKVKTAQIWQGTSPLEIEFTFPLIAEQNANDDVIEQVKKILQLPLPSTVDGSALGRFIPPGPSFLHYLSSRGALPPPSDISRVLKEAGLDNETVKTLEDASKNVDNAIAKEEEEVTIKFGNFLTFRNVVILSSNVRLLTQQLHHNGIPLKAEVELRFRMYTLPHKGEVDGLFKVANPKNRPLDLRKLHKQAEKSANSFIKSKYRGLF